jgi:hypothetical protein
MVVFVGERNGSGRSQGLSNGLVTWGEGFVLPKHLLQSQSPWDLPLVEAPRFNVSPRVEILLGLLLVDGVEDFRREAVVVVSVFDVFCFGWVFVMLE